MGFHLSNFVHNVNNDNTGKMEIEKAVNSPEINFITYSRDTQRKTFLAVLGQSLLSRIKFLSSFCVHHNNCANILGVKKV